MLSTSLTALVFIRACIFGLRSVTPIATACTAASILSRRHLFPWPLELYFGAETAFYLCWYLPWKRRLERPAVHPPAPPPTERRKLFAKCHETVESLESYLSGWFHGADPETIHRENLAQFLTWAFLDRDTMPDEGSEEARELKYYVDEFEASLGRRLPAGFNENVRSLRLTLDPVKMTHRSLLWYFMVHFVDILTSTRLVFRGLRLYPTSGWFRVFPGRWHEWFVSAGVNSPSKDFSYWYRPHTATDTLPVVFLHGLGIGLYPYVPFLAEIAEEVGEGVGIIALEIMPISMRICGDPLDPAEFSSQVLSILNYHDITDFVLVGHSYGTILTTHLLHCPTIGPRISSLLLIDPIAFLLHHPSVAYNFTCRPPRSANEHQLNYFASLDPSIAHTICRHFFWSQNILWREELAGKRCAVAMGGRDLLVDSRSIWEYLTGRKGEEVVDETTVNVKGNAEGEDRDGQLKVMWYKNCDHAQMFDTRLRRRRLVDTVVEFSWGAET